jgi:hypothetical protein
MWVYVIESHSFYKFIERKNSNGLSPSVRNESPLAADDFLTIRER